MANLSQFLSSSSPKAIAAAGPGSNGFWQRKIFQFSGTYTFTAPRSGKVKIQAVGAGSGASSQLPGNPGHFGEKTLDVAAGQSLTLVVGAGGAGSAGLSSAGGTTSISGAPVGGTPLVLPGAPAVNDTGNVFGTATTPSGPWDRSFAGGVGSAVSRSKGSPASAGPFGPGVHQDDRGSSGGCGWGGPSRSASGASSHNEGSRISQSGSPGRIARGGINNILADVLPFWDLEDVDSGGACTFSGPTPSYAGPGAGGAGTDFSTTSSLFGGTSFISSSAIPPKSGNGAGGGGVGANGIGGRGGDGFVMIFFDEVQ